MSIEEITALSRYYGSDPAYVLAGGGNTSFKDENTLAVKASGISLADISPEGFVRMNRQALGAVWSKSYPEDPDEREQAALADLLAAREPGEEKKRPSVETLLHDILPFRFVVHTHPALVNGLTCSRGGEAVMEELFPGEALWIPITNPGYILALRVKEAMEAFSARKGRPPEIIFLQNHGVFVGADTAQGIRQSYDRIMAALSAKITRHPDLAQDLPPPKNAEGIIRTLAELGKSSGSGDGWTAAFLPLRETLGLVKDRAAFRSLSSAYSPDHIVYAGSEALFVETQADSGEGILSDLKKAWEEFRRKKGRIPRIAAIQNTGVFGAGPSKKALGYSLELFTDAVTVAVYTESFGGYKFMEQEYIDFINNWEVERYRSNVSGITGNKS